MLIILAIDQEAHTLHNPALSEDQVASIQQLLIDHDPRLLINTDDQAIILNESELNSLLDYFKSNVPALSTVALNASIDPNRFTLVASVPLPSSPFGQFVNITIEAEQSEDFVHISAIEIGALRVPGKFFSPLYRYLQNVLSEDENFQLYSTLLASINEVSLEQDRMSITLNWQNDNLAAIRNQARQVFISSREISRLLRYHTQLTQIATSLPPGTRSVSLDTFLKPMFKTASINSTAGADPRDENRAIFIVLTAYLTELRLEHLTGPLETDEFTATPQIQVRIQSRQDIPRHIVSSAAIAASAGVSVANILSVYKEVHDSRYRSGFSFSDITANRVGTLLGELSTASTAEELQNLLANIEAETDYMPTVNRYDGMTEEDFIEQYQGRDSALYQQRLVDIEKEIAQRPVFQQFQ